MRNEYEFQVGDEVEILPSMEDWTYCVFPMKEYFRRTATITRVEIDRDNEFYIQSGYRVWIDIDGGAYFWSPDHLAPIIVDFDSSAVSELL